jgi:large subunit ribosomal protein L4
MKAAALRGALSDRAKAGRIHVVTGFVDGDVPSTRKAVTALSTVTTRKRILVVVPLDDAVTHLSLRNVPSVHLIDPGQLNTYDVMLSDDVVFTVPAFEAFVGRAATEEAL